MSIFFTPKMRGVALLLASVATMHAVPASAVTHIVNVTANPVNATTGSFSFNGSVFNTGSLIVDPFDAFTVEEGDIIEVTLTLASGFTVPGSMEQLFGFNFFRSDGVDPITDGDNFTVDVEGTSLFSFSMGPTGLSSDTQSGACGNCLTAIMGQIPGASFTFDKLILSQTILNLEAPYTIDRASFSYQLRDVAGAVPEPATWAFMILGFGLIGGAVRQRKAGALRKVALN